jgi:uncharacterized protein (DUF58 family)
VVALQVYDQLETEIPAVGLIKLLDAETGTNTWIDTNDNRLRMMYKTNWTEKQVQLKKQFFKSGVDFVSVKTDEDYVKSLIKLFKLRA